MRKLGNITDALEQLLIEMVDEHEMQRHEVMGIIDHWFRVHRPDDIETCAETNKQPEIIYDWGDE